MIKQYEDDDDDDDDDDDADDNDIGVKSTYIFW